MRATRIGRQFMSNLKVLPVGLLLILTGCGLAMSNEDRLDRAQAAFEQGEYLAAIIDAKNVLRDEPENVRGRLLLGRASLEIGDGASAEKELRRAIDLGAQAQELKVVLGRALLIQAKFEEVVSEITPDPSDAESDRLAILRMRGDALLGLGRPEEARALYTEALAGNSEDSWAQLGVVNTYIAEENFSQARETLNQVLTFDDQFVPAWMASGSLALRMRDAVRSESDYRNALEIAQNMSNQGLEIQALSGLADALFQQRNFEAVTEILPRMVDISPQDMRTLMVAAKLDVANEKWTDAQQKLQEILRRAPEYRPAQLLLGIVHKESGNLAQAEMYLTAVVAAAPGNAQARRTLAEIRLELNKAAEAQQALQSILSSPEADSRSLAIAAEANILLGELDEAEALLRRAVLEDPANNQLRLQLSLAYIRSGKLDEAQDLLGSMADTVEGDDSFNRESLLAIMQLAKGQREEALQTSRKLLETWPARAEAHRLLGSMEASAGDLVAARKSFETASELAPDDVAAIRNLARLDELEDDFQGAQERYLLILDLRPNDVRSMVSLAKIAIESERPDEAVDWLEKARAADARTVTPRLLLASLYRTAGKYSDAEKVAKEGLEVDGDNAALNNMYGSLQLNQQDYKDAEISFRRAVDHGPSVPAYRVNLAKAQALQGNKQAAVETLEDGIERFPDDLSISVALSSLLFDLEQSQRALTLSDELLASHPEKAIAHALRGEMLLRKGDLQNASLAYDEALRLKKMPGYAVRAYKIRRGARLEDPTAPLEDYLTERPLDTEIRNFLAGEYRKLGDIDAANAEYERVLSEDPSNFVAANNLAYNYFTLGDDRAEETARHAYDLGPENASVVDTLGWILIQKGSVDEGVSLLRRAFESGTNNLEVHYHYAAGLAKSGMTQEAKKILEELMARNEGFPSKAEAEALLAEL
jgi:putative PEP-CTERM system TPR-repeat lipoprotein